MFKILLRYYYRNILKKKNIYIYIYIYIILFLNYFKLIFYLKLNISIIILN